ncbi:YfcC family protein [Sporosarcina gallistercoris]|uniref:Basic amino acid antiporter YfcC n=1 Tax=Sporosarcina gallistercoris TaxID=2762245 RepID=A0ABR8PMA1_9BACL|nr:TIGR00366 family protein [Sporosarcina gallistercoris]MBD7909297.1 putative basic amino acid antiporter YfcC [Sporosarcina gallistercoris]
MSEKTGSGKRKWRMEAPHPFVILFTVIIIMAIATYLIPAGEYDRTQSEDGKSYVVDGSYHQIDAKPAGILPVFEAVHKGMVQSAPIIFFIFIVGGAFNVFRESNAIEGAFGSISSKLEGKEMYLIPIVMLFFGLGGAAIGMFEESLPFILIMIPLAIMMGFDSLVGTGMVLVGVASGFTAAFMNPFTVGVAQGIAEVPIFSGMGLRVIFWLIYMVVAILYVVRYARKVRKNPESSLVYEEDKKRNIRVDLVKEHTLTGKQITTLIILVATLIGLGFGVIKFGWYITEISALFLIMALIIGLVNGKGINGTAVSFVRGCEELVVGALVVGFAYGALVILQDSSTIDTILYGITALVSQLPSGLAAIGMYIMQCLLNIVVTSGSGQAALSMPIMTPLSDLLGVSRQTSVLAFQMGDGLTNIITPTSGLLLAALAMAKISFAKWFKWVWPLILIQFILGAIFVTIAHVFVWPA